MCPKQVGRQPSEACPLLKNLPLDLDLRTAGLVSLPALGDMMPQLPLKSLQLNMASVRLK